MRLEVDSAKQAARAACRRFAPESHPFKDKLRAARRLDPDQKNYLRDDLAAVPGISVWDYAMIGCFFGKNMNSCSPSTTENSSNSKTATHYAMTIF